MARDVDRADRLEPEVPRRVRVQERPHEAAAGAVDVQRHVEPALVAQAHEQVVDADDVVGVAGERRAEHGGDADRVLVDVRLDVLGPDRELVRLQRDDPRLDVEVAAELLPHDVHVAAEDEVRPVGRLARRLAPRAPLPLQRQRAEHDRLRRALRARAGRLARRVEEVGEHPDAALLDLRRLRVLGVVDVVAVQVLGDHPLRLGLHPRRHERREVAHRDPVEHELLAQQAHRVGGRHPGLRQPVVGRLAEQERVAVETRPGPVGGRGRGLRALAERHCVSLGGRADVAQGRCREPAAHHPLGMTRPQRTARAASRRVGGTGLTARAIALAAREASMPR